MEHNLHSSKEMKVNTCLSWSLTTISPNHIQEGSERLHALRDLWWCSLSNSSWEAWYLSPWPPWGLWTPSSLSQLLINTVAAFHSNFYLKCHGFLTAHMINRSSSMNFGALHFPIFPLYLVQFINIPFHLRLNYKWMFWLILKNNIYFYHKMYMY